MAVDPDQLWPKAKWDREESPEGAEMQVSREATFEEFYVCNKERVENYVRRLLYSWKCSSPTSHFEDVSAEVFVRARKSLHTFKEELGPYLNWVYRISRNQVYDHVRGPCTHEVSLDALPSSPEETPIHFAEPRAPSEDYDKLIWLNDKLDRMPKRYRQILLLIGDGYDSGEIAKIMGITANYARQLCFKARLMLKAED